jgi:hypothetical protein
MCELTCLESYVWVQIRKTLEMLVAMCCLSIKKTRHYLQKKKYKYFVFELVDSVISFPYENVG